MKRGYSLLELLVALLVSGLAASVIAPIERDVGRQEKALAREIFGGDALGSVSARLRRDTEQATAAIWEDDGSLRLVLADGSAVSYRFDADATARKKATGSARSWRVSLMPLERGASAFALRAATGEVLVFGTGRRPR